jgi:hypothetical protein
VFLIFNVAMVGLALAVIVIAGLQTEFLYGYFIGMLGLGALITIWPTGAILLGIAWLIAWLWGRRGTPAAPPHRATTDTGEYEPAQAERGHGPPGDSGRVHRRRASVAHIGSDMVTPRASADFLSRRAKREETQDDAPDADD